jgi:transcriptional regulator with GAF, ATPase, and Fis domain
LSQFIIDLLFSSIFVLLIILLIKVREKAFIDNSESFYYTFGGLTALGLVSLMQLADHQNLFESFPFLSEPIYQELVKVIGIVTGVAMMIAGISIWLPSKKKKETISMEHTMGIEVLDKIERQIVNIEDINHLFNSLPEIIKKYIGIHSMAVFRLFHKGGNFICTNNYGFDESVGEKIQKAIFPGNSLSSLYEAMQNLYFPDHYVPIKTGDEVGAIIFFWGNEVDGFSNEERFLLNKIGQSLSIRLTSSYEGAKESFYAKSFGLLLQANRALSQKSEFRGNLEVFYRIISQAFGIEFLSLTIPEKRQKNLLRYVFGIGGNMLRDGLNNPLFRDDYLERVMESKKGMVVDDIASNSEMEADSLFQSCGQRSLINVPIINYGRVIAVLTVGHSHPHRFAVRDLLLAETLCMAIAPIIEGEISRRANFERDRYIGALSSFQAAIDKYEDIDSLYRAATEILVENISTTMARVTMLNTERTELITRAFRSVRPFEDVKTDNVALSREMTPWHNMVISEHRPLLINQKDPEAYMDYGEVESLVISGAQSALMVPILVNGVVFGVITLGEMRSWERTSYDSASISFCRGVAATVASGIKVILQAKALLKGMSMSGVSASSEAKVSHLDVCREFRTPLSSLRGSIELLKQKGIGQEEESEEILTLMENSTDRMISLLNRE